MTRAFAVVSFAIACLGCDKPTTPQSTLKVSYYAQDSAFASVEPLRVSVGSGEQLRSLRGIELAPYHPFFVSGEMPLDSGATWPITVVMLGANADTAARAQLSVGPVEPAMSYTLGVIAGGRHPLRAVSRCGAQVAVPLRRAGGAASGDSLYVSISGMRDGAEC
jgi:hypothetical protein